ncbi:NAD(P)/FAD-dependent oxidoreductase [Microlunatus sp. Gsoil 973]|uniref:NAD(P)/FAD-dependent oxidoreductase n=1 Tax=Microlunatus sp. Gsoil 973 TaxID=2672569 RepID=UPI0012B4678D|nr:FAD-dependent oxidoreductase [Microlunatus sp. Gsoil 973]QGN34579.1 oxidoreductase [Microlunatus sp. Gsoil 973]
MHRVVIIGAGYAGIPTAVRLARQVRLDEVAVTLVSGSETFVERPRLHQLAVGQPIRQVQLTDYVSWAGVLLRLARVTGLDLAGHRVQLTDGQLEYDTLVYALGSNVDLTAVPGVDEHAAALTGPEAAYRLREQLTALPDGAAVTVLGGGLTGLETVAEIAESFPQLRTTLVTSTDPGARLAHHGRRYLERTLARLGVTVRAGTRVVEVLPDRSLTADGTTIEHAVCVWAGGFSVSALARESGLDVNAAGRAVVDRTFRSVSHPDVFVVGDAAAVPGPWGEQLAMGCRTGSFTGPVAADAIAAQLTGREPRPFRYRYFHECISLGRKHGLIQFLHPDERRRNVVLTGRAAIAYKNAVLDGARFLFPRPGPVLARRRRLVAEDRAAASPAPSPKLKV